MPRLKLEKELSSAFVDFLTLKKAASEATNAVNRQKTVLKNIFKERIKTGKWELGTYVEAAGTRFDYSVTEKEVIEPEDFLAMYENGDITKEQFLRCISVQKGSVDTHVGSDVTLKLANKVHGDSYDVRTSDMDIEDVSKEAVVTPSAPMVPKRRKKVGGKPKAEAGAKPKLMRRIRLKGKSSK